MSSTSYTYGDKDEEDFEGILELGDQWRSGEKSEEYPAPGER
jgi:hypothetical protein